MAAIVNVCVDPRLDHSLIRTQVEARLERLRLPAAAVYVTNEPGGSIGSAFHNTARLLVSQGVPIVLAAVLYHDDCLAEHAGRRVPLESSAQGARNLLADIDVTCPVLTGWLTTESSYLVWTDEAMPSREVLRFRMPRMFGR